MIYWSAEDQVFIAEVPELPGCVAHGSTPAEALSQAGEAIALWIETARKSVESESEDERRWSEAFASSQDVLAALAGEARAEHRSGRTLPLDPECM